MNSLSLRRPHLAGIAALLGLCAILLVWSPWSARANTALTTSNVAVNCEPRQQALVRQTIHNGELQVNIQCVNGGAQPVGYVDEYGRPLPATVNGFATVPVLYAPEPRLVPAVYAPRSAVRQASAPRYAELPLQALMAEDRARHRRLGGCGRRRGCAHRRQEGRAHRRRDRRRKRGSAGSVEEMTLEGHAGGAGLI